MNRTWVQVADCAEAMARMSDAFFSHPSGAMTVIGVTGTNNQDNIKILCMLSREALALIKVFCIQNICRRIFCVHCDNQVF